MGHIDPAAVLSEDPSSDPAVCLLPTPLLQHPGAVGSLEETPVLKHDP